LLSSCVRLSVPSVCLSVTSRYCVETTGRIELAFGHGSLFLPIFYTVIQGNLGIYKIRAPFSGTLSQKLRTQQQNSVKLVDGRACWPHLRRPTRRGWTNTVYCTLVDCSALNRGATTCTFSKLGLQFLGLGYYCSCPEKSLERYTQFGTVCCPHQTPHEKAT